MLYHHFFCFLFGLPQPPPLLLLLLLLQEYTYNIYLYIYTYLIILFSGWVIDWPVHLSFAFCQLLDALPALPLFHTRTFIIHHSSIHSLPHPNNHLQQSHNSQLILLLPYQSSLIRSHQPNSNPESSGIPLPDYAIRHWLALSVRSDLAAESASCLLLLKSILLSLDLPRRFFTLHLLETYRQHVLPQETIRQAEEPPQSTFGDPR